MTEKQVNLKNRILNILPKAAAAVSVTFQNPPFSPGRDHNRPKNATRWFKHPAGGKGFSIIPDEARRKAKDGSGGIDSQEPTSPKVSCMGQIKHRKKQIRKAKAKSMSLPKDPGDASTLPRIFPGRKSDAASSAPDRAPPLSQMKRFASGRDSLANFDLTDRGQVDDEEEEEVIIPFSAPILLGDHYNAGVVPLQPRKEINLWKRRTMAPPRPLRLNPLL